MHRVQVRSYFLLLLSIILILFGPLLSVTFFSNSSAAIDATTLDIFAENNIMFYDPSEQLSNCNPMYGAKPSGDQITWIGDSYTDGAKTIIEEKLPGVEIDSQQGRTVSQGLDILSNIGKDNLRPYLVFALGTNGTWSDSTISTLTSSINTDTKVILVTAKTKAPNDYGSQNTLIKKLAEDNKNIVIADWADNGYKDEFFTTDDSPANTHPKVGDGYKTWVDVIYNALPSGSAQATAGSSAQEIIWSFFRNQGFTEVQVAAIMGNAYVESNYTPSAHEASNPHYWGLFQWGDNESADYIWINKLYPILKEKGYSKYIDDSRYWKYLTDNAEGKLMPLEDLRGMLEVEMQFAMDYGAAAGKSWITEIKKADTIPLATEIFLVKFEGATGLGHGGDGYIEHYTPYKGRAYQDVHKRIAAAEEAYSKFTGLAPSSIIDCNPVNADPGDALAFLQQYVRDANYLYDTNATVPTVAKYYNADDPSTYTIVERKTSIDKTKLANMSDLSQEDKDYLSTVGNCFGGADCGQCTALSGWFVIMFTNYKYGGGAGVGVVNNLAANNSELQVSTTPTPWSIFSYGDGGNGHTGIVIDVTDSGEIITLEHNMAASRGGKRLTMRKYNPDTTGYDYRYVDLRNGLDFNHLGKTYE